jgi:hypothetical protein
MDRYLGRCAVVGLVIVLAACGGGGGGGSSKKTVTPEAKSAGSAAEQNMADSLAAVSDITALKDAMDLTAVETAVDGVGPCTSNCALDDIDLSDGLPAPTSISSSKLSVPAIVHQMRQRFAGRASLVAAEDSGVSTVYGCLHPDSSEPTLAVWDEPNGTTCTATDDLEITYATGDKVEYDWGWDATSVWTEMWVVSGPWSGTHVRYDYEFDEVYNGWSITTTGHAVYQEFPDPKAIDRYVDVIWRLESSEVDSSFSMSSSGDIVDLVKLYKFTSSLRFEDEVQISGSMGSISWSGSAKWADIAEPKSSIGPFEESGHVLEFPNFSLSESWSSSEMDFHYSITASGEVKYDGEVVGHLTNHADNSYTVYIHWNDGTETEFDIFSLQIWTF